MRNIRLLAVATALGVLLLAPRAAAQERFAMLHKFGPPPGGEVPQGLTSYKGALYGTTAQGGSGCGTVFELQPPVSGGASAAETWTETVLYSFSGPPADACEPQAGVVVGADGTLYGATVAGGTYWSGAVFGLRPPASAGEAWTETVLHSFTGGADGTDGGFPFGGVVVGPDGALYGATTDGTYGAGNVFELRPPAAPGSGWTETVLYNFTGLADGGVPISVTLSAQGALFGTTILGGTAEAAAGTVFELAPPSTPGGAWSETVLHSFSGGDDGSTPWWPVTLAGDGTIYGTTFGTTWIGPYTGPYGVGTVFELAPPAQAGAAWTKTVLHQFGDGNLWGPDSPVIVRDGNVYGTTPWPGGGLVFELQPPITAGGPWTKTILHQFKHGLSPHGNFVMDETGVIYGVTYVWSDPTLAGTVYRMEP